MQKFNERAIVLHDAAIGLMTKVAFHRSVIESPEGRPPSLANAEWAKVRKAIERCYPDGAELQRTSGFHTFEQSATQTMGELEDVYHTFVDLVDLSDATKELLRVVFAETVDFHVEQNRSVVFRAMELLTAYAQLHLLIGGFAERKLVLGTYAAAYQCFDRRAEPDFSRVARHVQDFDDPVRRLVAEVGPLGISGPVFDLCMNLRPSILAYLDPEDMRRTNMLNPTEEAGALALPVRQPLNAHQHPSRNKHMEMMDAHRYLTWVLYAGIVCPELFLREDRQFLDLFNTVSRDCLFVPVFREHRASVHELTDELSKWFPPRNFKVTAPRDLKLKKVFKEESKEAALSCGRRHREKRSYLRGEMKRLAHLCSDTPGLLGPKFPMVLAALSMGKAELLWYFYHKDANTRRDRMKHLNLEDFDDPFVSSLLGLQDRLATLVLRHRRYVEAYYAEYLRGAHLSRLRRLLAGVPEPVKRSTAPAVQQILDGLCGQLSGLDPARPGGCGLVGFRLDWARCACSFASVQSNAMNMGGVKELMEHMNLVVLHTRFVDDLDALLAEHAELPELWWCRDQLTHEFERALNDESEASASTISDTIVAYVKVAAAAPENVSAFCPDEQRPLGEAATRYADDLLGAVSRRVKDLVAPLCEELAKFDAQVLPLEAARRLERKEALRQRGEDGREEFPGWESKAWPFGKAYLRGVVATVRNLCGILSALQASPRLVVHDRVFALKEYVRAELSRFLQYACRHCLSGEAGMQRPTVALSRLRNAAESVRAATAYINMDADRLLRKCIFEESAAAPPADAEAPSGPAGGRLVERVAAFYRQLVAGMSAAPGVCFVPVMRTFARMAVVATPETPDAALYCEPAELEALCRLLGPHGVRAVEAELLAFVGEQLAAVKRFLARNLDALRAFRGAYVTGRWLETARQLQGLGDMMGACVATGMALSLRRILHDALRRVQRRAAPFVQQTLEAARGATKDDAAAAAEFDALDECAMDCGVESPLSDARLREVVQRELNPRADQQVVELLPFAFAALLTAEQWTATFFLPGFDVFTLNEHVIAVTIRKLLVATQPAAPLREAGGGRLGAAFKDYMKCASFVLLRMKMLEEEVFAAYPLRAMVLLLESFVRECPFLERSMLEDFMPYSILHNSYMDISLGKQKADDVPQSVAEAFGGDHSS